jgi:hypothetical protein
MKSRAIDRANLVSLRLVHPLWVVPLPAVVVAL